MLRLVRLLPLHIFMMFVWFFAIYSLAPFGGFSEQYASRNPSEGFLVNLLLLNSFGLENQLSWNYPAWSIGAELIAYLLFFLVIASLGKRVTAKFAIGISLFSYVFLLLHGETTIQKTFDLGYLRCIGGFFLGVAVFRLQESGAATRQKFTTSTEFAAIALMTLLLLQSPGSVVVELLSILSFGVVVIVFANSEGLFTRGLCSQVPQFVGRISYSIYLMHALVIIFVVEIASRFTEVTPTVSHSPVHVSRIYYLTPYAVPLTLFILMLVVLFSAVTHRFVEQRFQFKAKQYFQRARACG